MFTLPMPRNAARRRPAPRSAFRAGLLALACLGLFAPAARALPDGEWRYAAHLPYSDINRTTAVMVFDPVRDRMLLLGGDDGAGPHTAVWALPTTGAGSWTLLPATGAPSALGFTMRACYDTGRDRLVVWDPATATLWTVTLDGTLHWTGHPVPGPAPGSRSSACAFDAERSQMLVFGGIGAYGGGNGAHAEVWSLAMDDTATWRLRMPSGTGPTGRANAVAVVDPTTDRLIVSGGREWVAGVMTPRGDVWALPLTGTPAWTALFTADTTAGVRWFGHAAVLDTSRRRLLVLGGEGRAGAVTFVHDEVAAFPLDGPYEWSVAAPPDPERGAVSSSFAGYDGGHDAVFEYGFRTTGPDYATRRLALSPAPAWSPLVPPLAWPPQRFGQAAAYDPARGRWLAFGGRYTVYMSHTLPTWTYDDLRSFRAEPSPLWEELPVAGPKPPQRQYGQMLHDPASGRTILFGGNITTGIDYPSQVAGTPHFYGDAWALEAADPPAWTPLAPGAPGPAPRDGHVMALDTQRHRLLVFGGRDSLGAMNDAWSLPLDGPPAWTELAPSGDMPEPRSQAVGAYDPVGDRLVVACGRNGAGALTDAWELRFGVVPLAWAPLLVSGSPPPTGPYARPYVFDAARGRVLVFGAGDDADPFSPPAETTWELSLAGPPQWAALSPPGAAPAVRYGAAAAMDAASDRVAFFGGTRGADASYCQRDHWLLAFSDAVVPALVSLVSADAAPGRVALEWRSSEPLAGASVERRGEASGWETLGEAVAAGEGVLGFMDTAVRAGARYAYRLSWNEGGREVATPEVWVEVPAQSAFALEAPSPNPSAGAALVSFVLPAPGRATLALFDVTGRRVESHDVSALGPGRHVLPVGGALAPGLYLVRLTRDGASVTRRWCVVR